MSLAATAAAVADAVPSEGVRRRARVAAERLEELTAWIVTDLQTGGAAISEADAHSITAGATGARAGLAKLHAHARTHPDTLRSGGSDCPEVVLRLLFALHEAGHLVVLPHCVGCGRSGMRLPCRVAGGRLCGACADRHRARPCSRCGQVRTVYAVRDGNPVCPGCYGTDPATGTLCSSCGIRARVAARTGDDGRPLCRGCYQPPKRACIHCGNLRRVSRRTPDGPVCQPCIRFPLRRCQRCGTLTKLATRSNAGEQLCSACLPTRGHVACHDCDRLGPWRVHRASGHRSCPDCRPQPAQRRRASRLVRECAGCHRTQRIVVTWPLGPVCRACYKRTRLHPDRCTGCGDTRVLINHNRDVNDGDSNDDGAGGGLCTDCSGHPEFDYRCRRCGQDGFAPRAGLCQRCCLDDLITGLLAGPDGTTAAGLEPFARTLRDTDAPGSVLHWLRAGQPAHALVQHLAASGEPVSHELLDSLPPSLALHRLRQSLVHTGTLPARHDYLERLVPWLEQQLAEHPPASAHLVRTWVHWTLLRRARHRSQHAGLSAHAGNWLRARIRAAINLLAWLDGHDTTLADATQAHIDAWLVSRPTDATYAAREFVHWARQHGQAGPIAIPKKRHRSTLAPITEDERWTQLRRCLHEDTLPHRVRAAGALVLLFGIPVSTVNTLRHSHLRTSPDSTHLQLGQHHLLLPPAVADLLLAQRDHGTGVAMLDRTIPTADPWLFPGGLPGRPARDALYRDLRRHLPVHLRRARSAALAALAADLPAPVLASLLNLNINTAIAWNRYAQHDWTSYLAARTTTTNTAGSQ